MSWATGRGLQPHELPASVRHRLVEGHARDHHVAQELLRRLDIPERGVAHMQLTAAPAESAESEASSARSAFSNVL